jgi:hypothetical protein
VSAPQRSRAWGPLSAFAICLVAAACAAQAQPTASQSAASFIPAASPSPTGSATPSPEPTVAGPSESPSQSEAPVDGTGEFYALDCSLDGPCVASYLPGPVGDEPGWPVVVSGPCRGTAKARDGSAYAACDIRGEVLVHRFGSDSLPVAGWPVRLPGSTASVYWNMFTIGCGDDASSVALTSGESVVVATVDGNEAMLHVLDARGKPRPGWPRPFPGDAPGIDGIGGNGCRGFVLGPDEAVLAWGYEGVEDDIELVADRTEFVIFERDGRTRSGWPRGSTGAASRPIFADDGSVVYVSASGKVWRHDADGTIDDGWPYQLPTKVSPYLSPDGRIVAIAGERGSQQAISLDTTGAVSNGWPVPLVVQTSCLFGDTPCSGSVAPVFSGDGTLYAALNDGSVIAVDAAGEVLPGWPVGLGAGVHAVSLILVDDARLVVTTASCPEPRACTGNETPITLVLGRDGPRMEVTTAS